MFAEVATEELQVLHIHGPDQFHEGFDRDGRTPVDLNERQYLRQIDRVWHHSGGPARCQDVVRLGKFGGRAEEHWFVEQRLRGLVKLELHPFQVGLLLSPLEAPLDPVPQSSPSSSVSSFRKLVRSAAPDETKSRKSGCFISAL